LNRLKAWADRLAAAQVVDMAAAPAVGIVAAQAAEIAAAEALAADIEVEAEQDFDIVVGMLAVPPKLRRLLESHSLRKISHCHLTCFHSLDKT